MQCPSCREGDALLGVEVSVGEVANDFFSPILRQTDVHGRRLSSELDLLDSEGRWADLRSLDELEV